MGARHKDVMLYAKMWQWRFINKYKKLLDKTAQMLRKMEWKRWLQLSDRNRQDSRFTVAKTQFAQKTPKFGRPSPNFALLEWQQLLPRCGKTHIFFVKLYFHEHGFRSGGSFLYPGMFVTPHLREEHPIHVVDGLRSKVSQHCWDGRCLLGCSTGWTVGFMYWCKCNVRESCYVQMYLIH